MNSKPVHIPRNFLSKGTDVFQGSVSENHDLEQYFWTSKIVQKILDATQYMYTDCCCFTTPSLAHVYHQSGNEQTLLDIDERFHIHLVELVVLKY